MLYQVFEIVLTASDVRMYSTFQGILNIMPGRHRIRIEAGLANAWLAPALIDVRNENLEPDTVLIIDGDNVYSVFRHTVIGE